MAWLSWLEQRAFYLLIALGSMVGLAALYSYEDSQGRRPTTAWLWQRLLLAPFLCLFTAALAESFDLTNTWTAFVSAMMAVGSFGTLQAVQDRFLAQVRGADHRSEAGVGRAIAGAMTVEKNEELEQLAREAGEALDKTKGTDDDQPN